MFNLFTKTSTPMTPEIIKELYKDHPKVAEAMNSHPLFKGLELKNQAEARTYISFLGFKLPEQLQNSSKLN